MSSSVTQDPTSWRIRLFGRIEVTTPSGQVIHVTSKKTGELLAYLALHPNQEHSREKLADIVWGASEVGDSRVRLRQEILYLRSLLSSTGETTLPLTIARD